MNDEYPTNNHHKSTDECFITWRPKWFITRNFDRKNDLMTTYRYKNIFTNGLSILVRAIKAGQTFRVE